MAFRKDNNTRKEFSNITISLASPETILEQSYGENEDGAKTTRFKVSFVLNSAALKFSTKGFVVKSPSRKDVTDSKTKIPDDIFSAESNSEGGTN